jgi:hypothetical protein
MHSVCSGCSGALLGRLVDPKDVAGRIREGEPPPARIVVDRQTDLAPGFHHAREGRIGVVRADQRQDPFAARCDRLPVQPAELPPVLGSLMPA